MKTFEQWLTKEMCEAHEISPAQRLAVLSALHGDYYDRRPETPTSNIRFMHKINLFLRGYRYANEGR